MNSVIKMIATVLIIVPFAASADVVSEKDVQVSARTLGFVDGIAPGDVAVAIIHDPANDVSKSEADALTNMLGGGLKAGKHVLKPLSVPISSLDLSGATVAFVTQGLSAQYDAIYAATSAANIMSISTDFDCVAAKKCVMGVASVPAVKIQISRAAADGSGLNFSSALKMMVTETE